MPNRKIEVFLSCSFASADDPVNELVQRVAKALQFECQTVRGGFTKVPSEMAREIIAATDGLIAVVTPRERLDSGQATMPFAVREEIAMAHAQGKPIIIVADAAVKLEGFMDTYCTHLVYTGESLGSTEFVGQLISTLFTFREELRAPRTTPPVYADEYYSERTKSMMSLDYEAGEYWWTVSTKKRLRFEKALEREILSLVWPAVPSEDGEDVGLPTYDVTVDAGSRGFEVTPVVRDIQRDRLELTLRFRPDPQPGDLLEFTRTFRSRRLNPLIKAHLPSKAAPAITIGGRQYTVRDGVLIAERVQKLHVHYSFAPEYGLRPDAVAPFVASYGYSLEYLAPWELNRVDREIEAFGKKLVVEFRIADPIPRYLYGLAWDPPDTLA